MSNRTIQHLLPSRAAGPAPEVAPLRPELAALLSVLFLQLDEVPSMVLHVTSAGSRAGTTTIARDIAAGAAAAGWCSVALIDAHPQTARHGAGLIELAERGDEIVLSRTRIGGAPVDRAALSLSGQTVSRLESVRTLYGALRRRYSLVVVDCPPVSSGQQMMVLAPAADETILVVEAERTNLADAARAREALERRGASIMGVVMNKSRRRLPRLLERLL